MTSSCDPFGSSNDLVVDSDSDGVSDTLLVEVLDRDSDNVPDREEERLSECDDDREGDRLNVGEPLEERVGTADRD